MSGVRKILKDTCILAALMIFAVFTLSIIWSGITAEIELVLILFGLALIITVVNYLFDEFLTPYFYCVTHTDELDVLLNGCQLLVTFGDEKASVTVESQHFNL